MESVNSSISPSIDLTTPQSNPLINRSIEQSMRKLEWYCRFVDYLEGRRGRASNEQNWTLRHLSILHGRHSIGNSRPCDNMGDKDWECADKIVVTEGRTALYRRWLLPPQSCRTVARLHPLRRLRWPEGKISCNFANGYQFMKDEIRQRKPLIIEFLSSIIHC